MITHRINAFIGMVDRISAPLMVVSRNLQKTFQPVGRLASSFHSLWNNVGGDSAYRAFRSVSMGFNETFGHMRTLLSPLVPIIGLSLPAALGRLAFGHAAHADGLLKSSTALGLTIERLQEWEWAAKGAGVESEGFRSILTGLQKGIVDVARGQNQDLAELFARLGIRAKDAAGNVRGLGDVFPEVIASLNRIQDPAVRARVATALLGAEGIKLGMAAGQSADMLAKAAEEARRFGIVTEAEARRAAEFNDGWDRMKRAFTGAGDAIGAKLLPVLIPLLDQLTELVIQVREPLAEIFREWAAAFAEWLKVLDAEAIVRTVRSVVDGFRSLGQTIIWLIDVFGGLRNLGIGVAVLLAGPLILGLGQATVATGGLIARLAVLGYVMLGPLLNVITAMRAGYSAMAALNLAMAANPIGLVVLGIAALIAALVALWVYWEPITQAMGDAIVWLAGLFGQLGDALATIADWLWQGIKPAFDAVGAVVQWYFDAWMGIFRWIGEKVASIGRLLPEGMRKTLGLDVTATANEMARPAPSGGVGQAGRGSVDVAVRFANAPPGLRVDTEASGNVAAATEVGRSMAAIGAY